MFRKVMYDCVYALISNPQQKCEEFISLTSIESDARKSAYIGINRTLIILLVAHKVM